MKPPTEQAKPELDLVQKILQRRAEAGKNKSKYSLTEIDAKLLGTHSSEVTFADGQVIVEEDNDIASVYRIKSGTVLVSRKGYQLNVINKGWFIGDCMLIYNSPAYTMNVTMKAQGPVVLDQLSLPFIKQLFQVDPVLHSKVMRHLVSKYSFIFDQLILDLEHPSLRGEPAEGAFSNRADHVPTAALLTATISASDLSSEDSLSSISSTSSSSSGSATPSSPSTPTSSHPGARFAEATHKGLTKRELRAREHAAYKTYPLAHRGGGIQTLHLKSKSIKIVSKSFGFSFKTTIEFTKIINMSKVGESVATILYEPHKVANVFFKNYRDREEFFGLMSSLSTPNPSASPDVPKSASGQPLTAPHNPDLGYDEVPLCGGKEHFCRTNQTRITLKKGEYVFEEGDLFQRVYTVITGHCTIKQRGKDICTMEEGDVFGAATLLHLRPCPISLQVASETATVFMIPAYKIHAMVETDAEQAAMLYKHAAVAVDRQISKAIGTLPNYKRTLRERRERLSKETEALGEAAAVDIERASEEGLAV